MPQLFQLGHFFVHAVPITITIRSRYTNLNLDLYFTKGKPNKVEVHLFRIIICFALFFSTINIAEADNDYLCPKSVAATSGDPLSTKGSTILTQIYATLGCPIEIVFLPGRRGVSYFNQEKIDGELYRLKLIESAYTKKFARSAVPLFEITNAVWVHPNLIDIKTEAIGYIIGIAWHEKFIAEAGENIPYRRVKFDNEEDMLAAFNNRKIGSFLSESQSVSLLSSQDRYVTTPAKFQSIESLPLYHYLQGKYAPFMKAFSTYLKVNDPFGDM